MNEIKSCDKNSAIYPDRMKNIKTAPDILYYIGDISICDTNVIAVIGRRDADPSHLRLAQYMAALLADRGYTILNGLAIGVDASALEGALSQNGKVVAVMPGGLDEFYPKSNKDLAQRIIKGGGCLISEYPEGTRPQKFTFAQRDRIQAMLANKVFVVDSSKGGGTSYTAECAKKFRRPVGCYIDDKSDIISEGNFQGLKYGKDLIDNISCTVVCSDLCRG